MKFIKTINKFRKHTTYLKNIILFCYKVDIGYFFYSDLIQKQKHARYTANKYFQTIFKQFIIRVLILVRLVEIINIYLTKSITLTQNLKVIFNI